MPITKRFNSLQNLQNVDVLFEESGLNSEFFNITEFPDPLQVGKNSFLMGGSEKLANFIELKMDIVDFEGNSIYHEPVRGYLEGNMRRVSIEVYNSNSPGSGFLHIVGEANPAVVEVPEEWQGIYNVRYSRPISVNTTQINTQPIFFYKQPKIRAKEITKAFIEELYPSASYQISGSVTVTATNPGVEADIVRYGDDERGNPAVTQTGPERVGKFLTAFKNRRVNKRSVGNTPTVLALGRIQRRASPEVPTHTITVNNLESSPENADSKVTSAFVGGTIEINNPVVDESSFYIGPNPYIAVPSKYVTRIEDVVNETTIIPEKPFQIEVHANAQGDPPEGYDDPNFMPPPTSWPNTSKVDPFTPSMTVPKQPNSPHTDETGAVYYWKQLTSNDGEEADGKDSGTDTGVTKWGWSESGSQDTSNSDDVTSAHYVSILANSDVTMSVMPTPGNTLSATHFRSYADFSCINMRTFSGDIFRVKVYGKLRGGIGDFELLYDSPIESPQVLIDPFSVDGFKNTGYFYDQSIIDDYWASSSYADGTPNGTVTQDNQYIVDGALMSGSNAGIGEYVEFFTTSSYTLERNVDYSLNFDAYYVKQDKVFSSDDGTTVTKKAAELKVYLSGSKSKDGTGNEGKDIYLGAVKTDKGALEGEVKGVFNTFLSSRKHFPSAVPKFVAEAGQWVIKDLELKPTSDTNFSPDYFRTIIPLPVIFKRPAEMDFLVEFYDVNNNIADAFAFMERFRILGAPQTIDAGGNLLSGSLFMGSVQGEGIELYGGSAYIRSIGYEGFQATISSGSGGFMMWSGSLGSHADGTNKLQTTESYEGVGLEIVDAHGTGEDRYLQFRTNPSTFKVVTNEFFLGSEAEQTFVSGSNNQIEIKSDNFHLTAAGSVTMAGTITATAGAIGGFTINANTITATNFEIDPSGKSITIGTGTDIFTVDGDEGLWLGHGTFASAPFRVTKAGALTATDATMTGTITANAGQIGGFHISPNAITGSKTVAEGGGEAFFISGSATGNSGGSGAGRRSMFISASKFQVTAHGDVTGSQVLFEGGKIGGWTVTDKAIYTTTAEGSSSGMSTYIDPVAVSSGSKAAVRFFAGATGPEGSGSAVFNVNSKGQITGSEVKFTGGDIGGFTIGDSFISSSNLLIHADDGEIRTANFQTGFKGWRITAGVYGGIDSNGTAEFENIRVRGTLRTAVFEKETVNAVGGQLYIGNSTAISASASATDTKLFCDNVSGFKKDEVIFAKKVTGTGFTKEYMLVYSQSRGDQASDNDMSGYLYVTRSYGGQATASSFDPVTYITEAIDPLDDIIEVHDADPTGSDLYHATIRIDTEIMQVSGSDTATNKLYVIRGTNGSAKAAHVDNSIIEKVNPDVAFLLGLVSPAENYTEGQVLVSTGRYLAGEGELARGSGYALINANPGDATTPYMDFIERTGSGIYDELLKTRVGDLSGLVGTKIGDAMFAGNKDPGFGMVSENIYLSGLIKAQSGSIGGLEMTPTEIFVNDDSGQAGWKTSNSQFYVNSTGSFSLGNKISWDPNRLGGARFELTASEFSILTTGANKLQFESSNEGTPFIAMGSTLNTGPQGTNAGVFLDGTGSFLAYGDASNYIKKTGTALDIKSATFDLITSTQRISSSYGGKIAMGVTIPQKMDDNGILLSGSGEFNLQKDSNNYVRYTSTGGMALAATNLAISSSTFNVTTANTGRVSLGITPPSASGNDGIYLSGSGYFSFQTGSSYIRNDSDGFAMNFPSFSVDTTGKMTATDGTFKGHLEARTGFIGQNTASGWNIDGSTITDTSGSIVIDATANSPNISITSGSFFAEMVPDFTPGEVILKAGGNNFLSTPISGSNVLSGVNGVDTGVISLANGQTSTGVDLFAGFPAVTASNTPVSSSLLSSISTSHGNITEAALTGGTKAYKSKVIVRVEIIIDTPQFGSTNDELEGTTTLGGNLILKDEDDAVVEGGTIPLTGGHNIMNFPNSATTKVSVSRTATITHTVTQAGTEGYYWHLDGITVTNDGITESYEAAGKTFSNTVNILRVIVTVASHTHTPSNKKVEMAPGGFQAVFLIDQTLETADNYYFRVTPAESKTVDILGGAHITGSLKVKGIGTSDGVILGDAISGSEVTAQSLILSPQGTAVTTNYKIHTATNQMNFNVAGVNGMRLSNAGALLVKDDITGFSTALSDRKFKENIITIGSGLDKILQLRGVEFDWKGDYKHKGHDIGFIAQEVETVDGLDSIVKEVDGWEEGDKIKTVSYDKVIPLLVEAVKEQQKQRDEMEDRIAELEKKYEVL